jgi:hypothetical protein
MRGRKPKNNPKTDGNDRSNVIAFPQHRQIEHAGKADVLAVIKNLGIDLNSQLRMYMRIPAQVVRGSVQQYEFHDVFSTQPSPSYKEDTPEYCLRNSLPAPKWIDKWYFSITDRDGEKIITFIDRSRGVAVQGSAKDQDDLIRKIYHNAGAASLE